MEVHNIREHSVFRYFLDKRSGEVIRIPKGIIEEFEKSSDLSRIAYIPEQNLQYISIARMVYEEIGRFKELLGEKGG